MITKEFINSTKQAYKNTAELRIEGDKLVIRNTITNVIHKFKNGDSFIRIGSKDRVKLSLWGVK